MRYLFILLFFTSVLIAQDRTEQLPSILATVDAFAPSGSDYIGSLKVGSPTRLYAYTIDSIAPNDRFIDAAGRVYEVTAISSRALNRIALTLSPQDTVSFAPKGRGWIWRPDSLGLVPVPADVNGWISQALKGKIEQHNLKILRDRTDLASEITPGADGTFLTSYGGVTSWENVGVQLYASPRTYAINDLVVRDGLIYKAKTAGATNPTVVNTTDWELATKVAWDDIEGKPTDLATDADVAAAQAAAQAYADANDEGSNWTINGSNIYRNSRIGIGASSPNSALNFLATSSSANNFLRFNASTLNMALPGGIDFMESSGLFGASGQYGARIYYDGSANLLKIRTAAGTTISDAISVKRDGGDVGFGTDVPTRKADINGRLRVRSIQSGSPTGILGYEADGDIVDMPQSSIEHPWESSGTGILYDGDFAMLQSGSEQLKKHGSRTHVGYDLYSVEPSGTGYLIISFPEEMDTDSYYFSIEIGGYGYGNTSRGFQATVEGYKYAPNDLIYNSSTRMLGSMVGGIRTCIYNGKPSFILGDGNTVWSSYEIIEVKRLHTRTASSTQPNFYDGWSSTVVADETGVTLSATGTVQDQTPFSTLGVAGSDQKVTTYLNVRNDEIPSSSSGYKVLQIAGYSGDIYNGEIELSHYTTGTLERVATINFNCFNGTGFAAEYARIDGDFGSNKVQFGRNSDDTFFVILGDGTDVFSTFGTLALTRLTVRGNKSGRYGTSAIEFVHMDDLSSIESIVDVSEVVTTDNIYNTSGTAPAGRLLQSYDRPGGTLGRTNLYFARPGNSGTYHTGFESFGNNSTGFKLDHRVNGSGTTLSSYLELKTGAHIATMSGDTWYYNNGGQYFGIKWSGLYPQWRVGTTQFLDFPNALPTYDNMQWTQDRDGSGKFVIAPYRVSKDRGTVRTFGSAPDDDDLGITVPGGSYKFKVMLVFEGNNAAADLLYYVKATGGTITEDGYTASNESNVLTSSFGGAGETVPIVTANAQHQVILEGTFIASTTTFFHIEWGSLTSPHEITMMEGSNIELIYQPNNL